MHVSSRLSIFFGAFVLVLVASGCDTFSSGSEEDDLRDRLVGTWVIEEQVGTYLITTDAPQMILDPDVPGQGTMTLSGRWNDYNAPSRFVDEPLLYARHTARPIYQGYGPALLLSTAPIQNVESVRTGEDDGFVVQLSDVYDRQRNVFTPDGFLEGIITTSYYEQYPGRPELIPDTVLSDPLPPLPPLSRPAVQLNDLPFAQKFVGSDTVRVGGTLRPAVQTIPAGVETAVDAERTPAADLARQKITYTFTENDSVYVSAAVNGDTLRISGAWEVSRDTLRIWQGTDTTTALLDLQRGIAGPGSEWRMTFEDPLCTPDDTACRTFYEYTFGLAAGTLRSGTWRRVNDLAPNTPSASKQVRTTDPGPSCQEKSVKPALCDRTHLLRGGAPELRPPTRSR